MKKFSREEILHIAKLAKLSLIEEEISKYQEELSKVMNTVEKIEEIEVSSDKQMIAPFTETVKLRKDEYKEVDSNKLIDNAPRKTANMIEVPVMINE